MSVKRTTSKAPPLRQPFRPDDLSGVLVVVSIIVAGWLLGPGLWFFSDDWNIISSYPSGRLLDPFNSHLSLVPIGIYQLLFHSFGLNSYTPFRIVGLAAYGLLGIALFRYCRFRLGSLVAAIATAAVLWNSGGVTNVMFPFLMNFSIPVAALLIMWWYLEAETVGRDVFASLWLCVALATSGLGLLVAVAIGVEMVWSRPPLRRWLILAPGPVLWLGWYLKFGADSPSSGGLRPIASYSARMIWGGFDSLTGGSKALGLMLAVVMVAIGAASIIRWRTFDGRVIGTLAGALAFAILTAISRLGVTPSIPPDELRYKWTMAFFLVLALVNMLPPAPPDADALSMLRSARERPVVALSVLAALAAIVANVVVLTGDMIDWNTTVAEAVPGVRDNLWVAEATADLDTFDRDRQLPVSYVRVTSGDYVAAVAELGSPLDELSAGDYGGSADARRTADSALFENLDVRMDESESKLCRRPPAGVESSDAFAQPTDVVANPGDEIAVTAGDQDIDVLISVFGGGRGDIAGVAAAGGSVVGSIPAEGWARFDLPALPERRPGDALAASLNYRVTSTGPSVVVACGE